jgi:hypothetical protein
MGDVIEYLVDGVSGLAPGEVDGLCLVAGVCSEGTVGNGYFLGKSSNLEILLGEGPLVDRLRDVFATAGQAPYVIAVPVEGEETNVETPLVHVGDGPDAAVSGTPAENADVVVEIVVGGALETATYRVSEDGGETWDTTESTPANGEIAIGDTGMTLTLEAGTYEAGDTYSFSTRLSIGPVTHTGTGPDVPVTGTIKADAQVEIMVVDGGGRNEGTYKLSLDGGNNYGSETTIPVDGAIAVGTTGATFTVPDSPDMVAGDLYAFDLMAPTPTIESVMDALETPLDLYDVEFIYVVGPSDSVDWAAMGVKADELWNAHRPTFFMCETRPPYDGESLDTWTTRLIDEQFEFAHRFVVVVAAYGEVSDSTGARKLRNWGGLHAGRTISIPVMRATGRVRDGGISQGFLPDLYTEGMQQTLEGSRYVTAKRYAGLRSAYWGDARTMAEVTSDFQYMEVVRTVFKAVRKARIAALKSMYDEVGDAILGANATGLAYLRANIETALDTMTKAVPQELAAYVVTIPPGQDIVNNGVAVEIDLIGIPIIRQIKLYARYIYAGSRFDPRIEAVA